MNKLKILDYFCAMIKKEGDQYFIRYLESGRYTIDIHYHYDKYFGDNQYKNTGVSWIR